MKNICRIVGLALTMVASAASAGPAVSVTVKNQSTQDITFSPLSGVGNVTSTNSSPQPANVIRPGTSNVYRVTDQSSPFSNSVQVRYASRSKNCIFRTTFVAVRQAGGYMRPQWNKAASAGGGASCTATITNTNTSTNEWAVEFVMR